MVSDKTKIFVDKSIKVHGDKYDYSLVNYVNNYTKVKIICKEHGIFEQSPNKHISGGCGCSKCYGRDKTNDIIILQFKEVHKDLYDYSLVNYINCSSKVKIICKEHGVFEQTPSSHLLGHGCPKCVGRNRTTEEIIRKFKEVHYDLYDYSLVDYKDSKIKVKIICKEHGIFEQSPNNHINGQTCPKCYGRDKTKEKIIEDFRTLHNNTYDYSLVDYINNKTKVKIICKEHGEFLQTPNSHLTGVGCPKCCGRDKSDTDIILQFKEVHGDRYDYSLVKYVNAITKVMIICKIHGVFEQLYTSHIRGSGCPKCRSSKGEDKIRRYLLDSNIPFSEQKRFKDCKYNKPLPFDFFLPDYNLCIEFDGEQHYREFSFKSYKYIDKFGEILKLQQLKDKIKTDYCLENNIKLIRIPYWDKDRINEILENELIIINKEK